MTTSEASTCDICGALVANQDRHDDWHREVVTQAKLDEAFRNIVEKAQRR